MSSGDAAANAKSDEIVMNVLTMNDVHANLNRMLTREVVVTLESKTKKFTLDACCADDGKNAHCKTYCSPSNSFLKADVCDQHVLLHPPFAELEAFIKHYLKCKARAPQTTSACVVVPSWRGKWRRLLNDMKLIEKFDKGSMLFTEPREGRCSQMLGPSPWDIEVWYDPPTQMQMNSLPDGKQLMMTFEGVVAGSQANVLIDSGASHNFIDQSFVMKNNLNVEKGSGHVLCAGKNEVPVQGVVKARVKIQSFAGELNMLMLDMPSEGLHVVLGQPWLKEHKAVLSYVERCVRFWRGDRRAKLQCTPDSAEPDSQSQMSPPLLTHMQFKRIAKRSDNQTFLVNVMTVDSGANDDTQSVHHAKVKPLLDQFSDVFEEMPPGLPPKRGIGHTISTGDAPPVSKGMYRLSPKEKLEVEKQVKELLEKGLIQPSQSPYGAPVIFVQKKGRQPPHVCGLPCPQTSRLSKISTRYLVLMICTINCKVLVCLARLTCGRAIIRYALPMRMCLRLHLGHIKACLSSEFCRLG